jgi:hypothetical protein
MSLSLQSQRMWIMNIVWPVTSLYLSVFGLWAYFRFDRTTHGDSAIKFAQYQSEGQEEQKKRQENGGGRRRSPIATAARLCNRRHPPPNSRSSALALPFLARSSTQVFFGISSRRGRSELCFNISPLNRCAISPLSKGSGLLLRQTRCRSWHFRLGGTGGWPWLISSYSRSSSASQPGRLLVDDAIRDGLWVCDRLSGEPAIDKDGLERSDGVRLA